MIKDELELLKFLRNRTIWKPKTGKYWQTLSEGSLITNIKIEELIAKGFLKENQVYVFEKTYTLSKKGEERIEQIINNTTFKINIISAIIKKIIPWGSGLGFLYFIINFFKNL